MPANRSRTLEWRRCLKQVFERGGALEIAVAQNNPESSLDQHLIWRVKLVALTESEICVEQPCALGQLIQIDKGIQLIVILSIGQNRWMFNAENLGMINVPTSDRRMIPALRLKMPESVQRCQRRSHHRVETASLTLPTVEVWPLLDPRSVMVAERAYQLRYEQSLSQIAGSVGGGRSAVAVQSAIDVEDDDDAVLPEVGPKFNGTLLNMGGGGVGLRVGPEDSQIVARHKLLWVRIALPSSEASGPATPICATGKVVHTHIESNHDLYVGLAFDFSFNPSHQKFVVEQICRYLAQQQKAQLKQYIVPDEKRRTA